MGFEFWKQKSSSHLPAPQTTPISDQSQPSAGHDSNQQSSQTPQPQDPSKGRWSMRNVFKGSRTSKSAKDIMNTTSIPANSAPPTAPPFTVAAIAGSTRDTISVATPVNYDGVQNVVSSASSQVLVPIQASSSQVNQPSASVPPPAPTTPPSLWEKTLDIANKELNSHGLPALDQNVLTSTPSATENIQSIVETLTRTQRNDEKVKILGKDRLRRVLLGVEKYTKIVDTAVQHSPQVTSLVWAGIKAILMISINHLQAMEYLEATLTTLAQKVVMCEFYAEIYATSLSNSLKKTLDLALPNFYSSIIVFSVKTREYFQGTTWITKTRNLFKPFEIEFGPFVDVIVAREKAIRECADTATMERIRRMENLLGDVKSEILSVAKLNDGIAITATENLDITKQIKTAVHDEKTYELLKMLSPLEPLKRHQDIKSSRLLDTGTWLLQLTAFCSWSSNSVVEQTEKVFCCYGIPGAGKTFICSIVVDDLASRLPSKKVGVACLYSDYRDQDAQTLNHILGSLLRQFLARSIPVLPTSIQQEILKLLEEIRNSGGKPGKEHLISLFNITLKHLDLAFICIDALDELEAKTRCQLLNAIRDLSAVNNTVRVFFTGRKHIQDDVQRALNDLKQHEIELFAHPNDIRKYLQNEIADDANPNAMDTELENEIITSLVERSHQMFLLPTLHIKMVLEMPTKSQRRKALQKLPADVFKTIEAIIARIQNLPQSQARLGMQVLMWLHLAYRPFELPELQHALSVETQSTNFDADNIPALKIILECCLGLVVLDEETQTIRFVHFTVEEHFRVNDCFPDGPSAAAETCLTYLNFEAVVPHCSTVEELEQRLENFAFLEYAAVNWGFYVARSKSNGIIKTLVLKLSEQSNRTLCPLQVLYCCLPGKISGAEYASEKSSRPWRSRSYPRIVTKLSLIHVAAHFGLVEIIQCLRSNADLGDDMGLTPLSWACAGGHEAVVHNLLAQGVKIDIKGGKYDQTPLSRAAANGHEAVVKLLLARDVVINAGDISRRTPLCWAAENGHEAVVKLLLARDDVDLNAGDNSGRTPLSWAVLKGHEAVIQLLLSRNDVDINAVDKSGRTLLLWPAENGREAVVKLLLAQDDVDPNAGDNSGRTPLSLAACNGHEAVVKLLLARDDVDINAKDNYFGRTPLSRAAFYGHEGVVKLLLARDDVDINEKNWEGKTAADLARKLGHYSIVDLISSKA